LNVLGITWGKTSGCSIFVDNKIIFAASEERYTRRKSEQSYPINAIESGLNYCKIKPEELDYVLIASNKIPLTAIMIQYFTNFSVKDHLFANEKYWYQKLVEKRPLKLIELFKEKIDFTQYPFDMDFFKELDLQKIEHATTDDSEANILVSNFFKDTILHHLKIDITKIIHVEHDSCHAAYALYGSPIREDGTLIFTADAFGDDLSATISKFDQKNNVINRIKAYSHTDFQLARIYRLTTLLLKMSPNEHEYKVMGLAPYYNGHAIQEVEKVFENLQTLDGLEFKFNNEVSDIFNYLSDKLGHFRFDHIAAGLQSFTEKLLVKWFSNTINEYGSSSVVFSGGVSMNVKTNMRIGQIPGIKNFFVCGAGTDETLAMGACYQFGSEQKIKPKNLDSLYLGDEAIYKDESIHKSTGNSALFSKYKINDYQNTEQILEKILENKIVATCRGRLEMGQRSLGNRSILADPRDRYNIEKINRMIKSRDFWMPFAPIILEEYQDEIIINPKKFYSPFMTIAFETKEGKKKIPAAVHQYDGTARPQILKKEVNPELWDLIKKFYNKTGIPALLNTSFNLHGEPIVRTIEDAEHVFSNSGLEVLWLDRHIVEK